MKLTDKDKKTLLKWGYKESDMSQLNEAARRCNYTNDDGDELTAEQAIGILGRDIWLSGVSRAAFHWTAAREAGCNSVYFDCSGMFRDIMRMNGLIKR